MWNGWRQRRRRLAQDCRSYLEARLSAKRQPSPSRFIEQHAKRPYIAQVIRLVPAQNLRGHVWQRSHQLALQRVVGKCKLADFLALHARGQDRKSVVKGKAA